MISKACAAGAKPAISHSETLAPMISITCAQDAKPPVSHGETIRLGFSAGLPNPLRDAVSPARDRGPGGSKMAPQALEKARFGLGNGAPASAAKRLRQDEDQKPDQPADQRPVDADILQIAADLQFEAADERGGVPIVDHRGDIAADLGPARQDRAQRQQSQAPVDPRPARAVLFEPAAERGRGSR